MEPVAADRGTAADGNGIQAVTFDFYNTLVYSRAGHGRGIALMEYLRRAGLESDPWEHRVLYDVFEPHGREYSPTDSPEDRRRYRVRFAQRVFGRLGVRGASAVPEDHAEEIWQLLGPASLALYPDVSSVLAGVKQRDLSVAVVSNWQCGLGHFCTELGIGGLLDEVIASAEVGSAKPEPEIFHEACRRLDVAPERTLHVGDSAVDDLDGARGAGLRAVLVERDGPKDARIPPGASTRPRAERSITGLGYVLELVARDA